MIRYLYTYILDNKYVKKTCNVSHINNYKLNPNWLRVGILPYYKKNNNIYLLLGIYQVSKEQFELCALSGGYKRTIETILNGAFREFNEETEQLFNDFEDKLKMIFVIHLLYIVVVKKVLIGYYFYLIFLNILKKFVII